MGEFAHAAQRAVGPILTPEEEAGWYETYDTDIQKPSGSWMKPTLTGRPCGIHPLASIGGPPEYRDWRVGDPYHAPEIHPTALVHAFCTIDGGIRQPTRIGPRTFLMARVHIGHDVQIGEDCELGAGVVICGGVRIGDRVKVHGNVFVRPDITIGDGARIGGGAVVVKDVPAGETWVGNPARPMGVETTNFGDRTRMSIPGMDEVPRPTEYQYPNHNYFPEGNLNATRARRRGW
jgi:acyl-[acyl carrier protein]--UDP-N-acetylglucosamine O-acyltransferase